MTREQFWSAIAGSPYSPEETATICGVHSQTVRGWAARINAPHGSDRREQLIRRLQTFGKVCLLPVDRERGFREQAETIAANFREYPSDVLAACLADAYRLGRADERSG